MPGEPHCTNNSNYLPVHVNVLYKKSYPVEVVDLPEFARDLDEARQDGAAGLRVRRTEDLRSDPRDHPIEPVDHLHDVRGYFFLRQRQRGAGEEREVEVEEEEEVKVEAEVYK